MVAYRWGLLLGLAVGALALPACVSGLRSDRNLEPKVSAPAVLPTPVAKKDSFAEFPRAPGQTVLKNPPPVPTPSSTVVSMVNDPTLPSETQQPGPIVITPKLPPDPPLIAAVRAYIDKQPELAIEHLKALDPPNQELMLQLIPAIVHASQIDWNRAGSTQVDVLLNQLLLPIRALSGKASLSIDKVEFCRDTAREFGHYQPLPEGYAYKPNDLADLYIEIGNAPSVPTISPTEGEGYSTILNCEFRIREVVDNSTDPLDRNRLISKPVREFTLSPKRDYHNTLRFAVPSKPGLYILTIEVVDPNRERWRSVRKTVKFRVR